MAFLGALTDAGRHKKRTDKRCPFGAVILTSVDSGRKKGSPETRRALVF